LAEQVRPVVVVSAMGRKGDPYATDTLIELIRRNGGEVAAREMDLLLACGEIISAVTFSAALRAEGIPSVVFTGGQAGIVTDDNFGNASIVSLDPQRILECLDRGQVAIVAGFQGMTPDGDVTTLGRGGSDTTAAALGVALGAEYVDIFTDVEGVLTADPRVVKEARRIASISYQEICNLAYNGAKVIHPRAVEIAMQGNVPIRVRSTFAADEGTLVASVPLRADRVRDRYVTGIAHVAGLAQIQVSSKGRPFDLQLHVFKAMAEQRISVDFISVNPSGVVYTVFEQEADRTVRVLKESGLDVQVLRNCAKVSVIGGGMNGVPGIMARIVEALSDEEIAILQTADSNATIWVLVHGEHMDKAVRALHRKFQLHE
jgi:aspartate kinase